MIKILAMFCELLLG